MLAIVLTAEAMSMVTAYSEMSALHQGSRPAEVAERERTRAELEARIERQVAIVADDDRQIAALDRMTTAIVEGASKRARTSRATGVITTESKQRGVLSAQRAQDANTMASLKMDAAALTAKAAEAEAVAAPIRALSALTGGGLTEEQTSRLWLLAMTLMLGPAAAGITYSVASRRRAA